MAYERGETALCREGNTFFAGQTAKDDFFEILIRKYGTLTRAWRLALDSDNSGLLDSREFFAAMDVIGFVGNMRTLWFNLDADQSGYISLAEIDLEAAQALEKFRAQCVKLFGSMDAAWSQCLDKDHSGALTSPELEIAAAELGYTDMNEVNYLFSLLRLQPTAFRVPRHEVLFLQTWEERKAKTMMRSWRTGARWVNKDPHFFEEPADVPKSWKPRKSSFTPPASRVRTATAGAGRMSTEGTESARKSTPKRSAPFPKMSIAGDATTTDKSLSVRTASEWADVVGITKETAWKDFESYLVKTFGSLVKAFDKMDTSGDGSIEREEWMHMVTRKLLYCRAGEALRLFDSKVVSGDYISFQDLGIGNEEWRTYIHEKRMKEQQLQSRNMQMKPKAFGGHGLRWKLADKVHDMRMKCKTKPPMEAFWTTLPSGWGFPPSYIDVRPATAEKSRRSWLPTPRGAVHGSLSARGDAEPAFTAWTVEDAASPLSAR